MLPTPPAIETYSEKGEIKDIVEIFKTRFIEAPFDNGGKMIYKKYETKDKTTGVLDYIMNG
jgi:hypothetical protein